jgi:hypothetical protein
MVALTIMITKKFGIYGEIWKNAIFTLAYPARAC